MAGSHKKPVSRINFKKIIVLFIAIAILSLAGIGFYQMNFAEKEILPNGITNFSVTVDGVEVQSVGGAGSDTDEAGRLEAERLKQSMGSYLNNVFIGKKIKSALTPQFFKVGSALITTEGKAKLSNIVLVYDEKSMPVLAVADLSLASKFYLPKPESESPETEQDNKQFNYGLEGEITFRKDGDWKVSGLSLDSSTKEYKVVEN